MAGDAQAPHANAAGILITVVGYRVRQAFPLAVVRTPSSFIDQEACLYVHFFHQYDAEIILGHNDALPRERPLATHVSLTETSLRNRDSSLDISLPKHPCPMAGVCVERAAVIKNERLYFSELHISFVKFLLPTLTSETPITIHTSSRMRVKKLA